MLAFLGGTGPEGRGLALRLAMAGEEIVIGSRDKGRAETAADELKTLAPGAAVSGESNAGAAQLADIVFVAVPYEAQKPLLEQVAGQLVDKVVVDAVVPLAFQKGRAKAILVDEGSAAMQAQQLLPKSLIVAAFHNTSAVDLVVPDRTLEGDVIVCSDHQEPKETVMGMVRKIKNLRPVDGGGLDNARYVEDLTALLLNINRIYKAHSGVKITGI